MDEIIYLAILEDRHIDIQIEPFKKIINALKQITEWETEYPDAKWIKEDIGARRDERDDGPSMRIEAKILR